MDTASQNAWDIFKSSLECAHCYHVIKFDSLIEENLAPLNDDYVVERCCMCHDTIHVHKDHIIGRED